MLHPLRDVVVIELDKTDETPGGIQLLDSHKDPAGTDTGTVLALNKSYTNVEGVCLYIERVVPGDKVLFMRKHGIAIKGNKGMVAVRYENLLAVIGD